ncbi:TPA: hypothetical protein ACXDAY_002174 [Clostridium botulinum]|uniref:hypothetical protein n=1 Tax=Clostridium botulinum TaxID=1491 RepID=UPI000464E6CF|nr:hypothetical protein [Clostridium botulinum]APH20949.1 hypothetical protein NPD1_4195 [Clostridium botulinum]APQ71139.1 hypothetical protein RSJ8_4152 [Clostridium botulinum]APR02318.1 hypothetical protein RSJ2_4015 [Clostridium botulinum]AUN01539.1 hypothetical protein RSJ19_00725 [Clostridium botulinum]MBN3352119.1 hypothetical protein [Clostridium botulinum]
MEAKYEATIKLTAIGEVKDKEDLIDNPKEQLDKCVKQVLEDEIGGKVDISIDSKFRVEE